MAFKKVVEMLGDNLASLLELAKKWLIDWVVDRKKLLDMLHQIRKEDLMGLISGTHEIKAKQQSTVVDEKFALFVDLGVVTVPDDYVHGKELASLNRKEFHYFNPDATDTNFSSPTRVLKPGDKLRVRVFKQSVSGSTTSVERMDFLKRQNAVFTGAQGVSLVYKQKREELPKGYWHCSFDEKGRLWKDTGGDHRVPIVHASTGGGFGFRLGCFEGNWNDGSCFLCFCDE